MIDPLVSVVVITYNSAHTVVETLDSIAAQTYQNIQLVISDDGSKDNTFEVCQTWIKKHKQRFVESNLVTVENNTGVCANLNRALKYVNGDWIKEIAGDDILLPNCIEENIEYVHNNPPARIVFSYPRVYYNEFKEENLIERLPYPNDFFDKDVVQQIRRIARGNFLYAPTKFYNSEITKKVIYDERYYFEDWVFYINALKNNYKFYLLEKETVGYRKSSASMQLPSNGQIFNYKMHDAVYRIKKDFCFPYLPIIARIRTVVNHYVKYVFEKSGRNDKAYIILYERIMNVLKKIRLA